MAEMFKRIKFFLVVAQKMNYDNGIIFTENNIVSYLAELEEYISSLITYTAFKKDDPNAPISSIPLENLNAKDHQKKPLSIEAPIDYQITQNEGAQAIVPPDLQGDIIDSKKLYAKFMEMVDTNQLQFVTHGNAKNAAANYNKEDDEMSIS